MKSLILFFTLLATTTLQAQIEIAKYDRQVFKDLELVSEIKAPEATSSCGEVTVETKEQLFSGGCLGNLVRTYTYTDACGNTAEAQQYIVLQDHIAPVFLTQLADIQVEASDIPDAPKVEVSDNSDSEITIEFKEDRTEDRLVRTWTATDACLNTATLQQILTFKELSTSAQ
ncbi:MAG: hypothetical protein KDC12_08795 [Flavobacteriales bacterium]|nr:hypothetical protein [Flavobacteriales bacterium]